MLNFKNFSEGGKLLLQIDENLEKSIQYEIDLGMTDENPQRLAKDIRRRVKVFVFANLDHLKQLAALSENSPELTTSLFDSLSDVFKNPKLAKNKKDILEMYADLFTHPLVKEPLVLGVFIDDLGRMLNDFPELMQHRQAFNRLYLQISNEDSMLLAFIGFCLKTNPQKAEWFFDHAFEIDQQIGQICTLIKVRATQQPESAEIDSPQKMMAWWVEESLNSKRYRGELHNALWNLMAHFPEVFYPRLEAVKQVIPHLDDESTMKFVKLLKDAQTQGQLTSAQLTRFLTEILVSEN